MKNIIFFVVALTAIMLLNYGAYLEDIVIMIFGIILGVPTALMTIYTDEVFK